MTTLFTVGTRRRCRAPAGLLLTDGAQRRSSEVSSVSPFGVTLLTMSPADLGADADDAALVQGQRGFLGDVGDVR